MVVGERADLQDARVSAADLYARHANHLFRFCLHQLRNRAEAEDAVQTTFLQAFRALKRGTIPHVERAWLIAIAQNVCRTMQRSSARRRIVETDADPELVAGAADADHPLREEISELERALARIPANQRRAFLLHEWRGLRYREIAGVMGISQTAVEMLAFRARRSLSQALDTGSARVRQALDVGGILTALRGLLSAGSGVHALAGVGIAGVALATLGASPAPVRHARADVRVRPAQVVDAFVPNHVRRHAVASPKRMRGSVAVNRARVTGNEAVVSATPLPSPPPVAATPQRSSASPSSNSSSNVVSTPTLPPVSLPPTTTTTTTTTALPVSVPPLPQPPAVTVPQLPVVSVSTPTVTLPSP